MKTISYELEAIFLREVVSQCKQIRNRHDNSRQTFSTAINDLFNSKWVKTSEPIKRGAMIGALKSGESVLNETQAYVYRLEELIQKRVNELEYCHAMTMKKMAKIKKGKERLP